MPFVLTHKPKPKVRRDVPPQDEGQRLQSSLQLEGEQTRGALIKSVTLLSLWWTSALGCCSSMPNGVFFS